MNGLKVFESSEELNNMLRSALAQLRGIDRTQHGVLFGERDAIGVGLSLLLSLDQAIEIATMPLSASGAEQKGKFTFFSVWVDQMGLALDKVRHKDGILYIHLRMEVTWQKMLTQSSSKRSAHEQFALLVSEETISLLRQIKTQWERLLLIR